MESGEPDGGPEQSRGATKRAAGEREEEEEEEEEEESSSDGRGRREALWTPARGRFKPGLGSQLDMESQRTSILHRVVSFAPDPLPARQYDMKTSEPISFYLSNLEELLAWKTTSDDTFNVATVPLAQRQPPLDSRRPRTLVCHDMKGGYLEDRFIQGTEVADPYVFYHWRYIDIFVYFSHHAVTIPPVVWTNAAHCNGVLMLGTFITEWTEGGKMCESFLAGEAEAYQAVAKQLAEMARFFCFDGWLVNIENSLSVTAARNLPHFLRYLTDQVHRLVPGGQVIWYDSILRTGELRWQNELNENNKVYFDVCDGFFTNYNWKEEHLLRTRELADDRRVDVYVGVDVFGRGDVVSGGFDTNKSLRMIREQGLSIAIFAPGWVYEHLGSEDFLNNEDKFWALLSELLPVHSVGSLPFCTSFNLGMGKRHFVKGQVPAPPRVFLLLIYKQASQAVSFVPQFTTRRQLSSACPPNPRPPSPAGPARHNPSPLLTPPPHIAQFLKGCGQHRKHGWQSRCYELELQNCFLDELSITLSRRQPGQDELSFACRLGKIWVLDAAGSLSPTALASLALPIDVAHVHWHQASAGWLSLNLTLRWIYPSSKATCFRVHYRSGACASGPEPPLVLIGEAHAPLYRVTELKVPEAQESSSCRLEFLVEPVPKNGLQVDPDMWGKLAFVYSAPKLPSTNNSDSL
ncbi:cytosolic endo-beta-N-acetylglucosaminidase isoform X4 [Anolis carolinensis]|uniref:cytosolic endo-beta-N-acetylglucosaminidase isoform X4 n=1 Tax=Anolis carolinensis TaxID=28377 RepID=UPI002F2B5323